MMINTLFHIIDLQYLTVITISTYRLLMNRIWKVLLVVF